MKKSPRIETFLWLLATLALVLADAGSSARARPQLFVPDPISGYALGGRDPVAYFVDKRPRAGKRQYELYWAGARWVFVNQGNRAAFEASPTTYAPAFAGCAAHSLALGFASAGNPTIFAIYRNQLLLFHSDVNRFLFLANPEANMAAAQEHAARVGCQAGR